MKKVYLIYAKIPCILFDSKIHDFVNDVSKYKNTNNKYIGLYAWTTKKILLNSFIEFRSGAKKIYNIIERKFTKEEFNQFRKENFHEELLYYQIPTIDNYEDTEFYIGFEASKKNTKKEIQQFFSSKNNQIVCTRCEFTNVIEYGHQYLMEYMCQIVDAEYCVFKSEYQQALDYIGYCDIFNDVHDGYEDEGIDEFYSSRHECSDFNRSYGLSIYGNPRRYLYENKLAIFISIFYEMIVGYNPDEEIKLLVYK